MSNAPGNLLNSADLEYIEDWGVPYPPREDLTLFDEHKQVLFTMKGAQFYKRAIEQWHLGISLSSLKTDDDLYRMSRTILAMVAGDNCARLLEDLKKGRVPHQERDMVKSKLFGTLEGWLESCRRNLAARRAGANVIPVSFRKN